MPHLIIDYSANLETVIDMGALCNCLREAACALEAFPSAGVRVRASPAPHYSIADGNPEHGYIDISVRLRAGRAADVKQHAASHLFDAVQTFVAPVMARQPVALSLEIRDIDPALSPKSGTIRDHL